MTCERIHHGRRCHKSYGHVGGCVTFDQNGDRLTHSPDQMIRDQVPERFRTLRERFPDTEDQDFG
jgi:hypothetical protein